VVVVPASDRDHDPRRALARPAHVGAVQAQASRAMRRTGGITAAGEGSVTSVLRGV